MRAREFIQESRTGSLQDDVAKALPATWTIPKLPNQDAYKQLRFGVAIAAAKSEGHRTKEQAEFAPQTAWGENQIVMSFDPSAEQFIDKALTMVGLKPSDKKQISTSTSEEGKNVDTKSPIPTKKKNKYGV